MKKISIIESRKTFLIFIFSFIFLYLVVATAFWIYLNYQSYQQKNLLMQKYVQNHHETLKQKIFTEAFSEAKGCNGNETCEKKVGRKISETIIEEEFTDSNGYGWPNDLFFVKQEGSNFYSLGWSGKIEDISHRTNKSLISSKSPYILLFITRNCLFFGTGGPSSSCETYETIPLSSGHIGYIVRLVPLTEENDFILSLFAPLIPLGLNQKMVLLGYLLIPTFGAFLITLIIKRIINRFRKYS